MLRGTPEADFRFIPTISHRKTTDRRFRLGDNTDRDVTKRLQAVFKKQRSVENGVGSRVIRLVDFLQDNLINDRSDQAIQKRKLFPVGKYKSPELFAVYGTIRDVFPAKAVCNFFDIFGISVQSVNKSVAVDNPIAHLPKESGHRAFSRAGGTCESDHHITLPSADRAARKA